MENKQPTDVDVQNQPLNGSNGNAAQKSGNARITKIKQKFLPGFRITLLLSLAIYVAMLVIGILGVHKCPVEENIPLFLIATGAIGLVTKITTYLRERIQRHFRVGYMESSLYTVETVFLILGAYWVYKEYPPNYDPIQGEYCQKRAYLFAFIYITIILVFTGIIIIGAIFCLLCCAVCFATISSCLDCDIENQKKDDEDADKDKEGKKEEEVKEGTSKD